MLDPASAVGLAASIIQITDFIKGILNDTHEFYKSADGALVRNKELKSVCTRLEDLMKDLKLPKPEVDSVDKIHSKADAQLRVLSHETKDITSELSEKLQGLMLQPGQNKWGSLRKAIETVIKTQKLKSLEEKLERNRREIDTSLLSSVRDWIQNLHHQHTKTTSDLKSLINDMLETLQGHSKVLEQLRTTRSGTGDHLSSVDPSILSSALLAAAVNRGEQSTKELHVQHILNSLHYDEMPERHAAIPEAFKRTFEWIFIDDDKQARTSRLDLEAQKDLRSTQKSQVKNIWDSFPHWLQDEQKLYWVSGKPGAGKSTFMKFLYHAENTVSLAQRWANKLQLGGQSEHCPPISMASFFFWIAGTRIQRSEEAMLRSLLYDLLSDDHDLVPELFPIRMKRCELFGGDLCEFSSTELLQALNCLLSRTDRRFLLYIDGLDEFEGEKTELLDLIRSWASKPCVKLCVASRPWPVFEEAFEDTPKLRIEYLTREDILTYVHGKFQASKRFEELLEFEKKEAELLISAIVEKAAGVFLWVYVVVGSLLQGLRDGDSSRDLHKRLDDLPPELEELFDRILSQVDLTHVAQASEIFQFVSAAPEDSTLLGLYLSDTPLNEVFVAPFQRFSRRKAQYCAEVMRRRLYSRCKCFLEVDDPCSPFSKVRYLHRTAKDFLERPDIWATILSKQPSYNTAKGICICRLMLLKRLPSETGHDSWEDICRLLRDALDAATNEGFGTPTEKVRYLDVLDELGTIYLNDKESKIITASWLMNTEGASESWLINIKPPARIDNNAFDALLNPETMFELAIAADFDWYVSIKLSEDSTLLTRKIGEQYGLIFAVQHKRWKVVNILMQHGADPNFRDGRHSAWVILVEQAFSVMKRYFAPWAHALYLQQLTRFLKSGANLQVYTPGIISHNPIPVKDVLNLMMGIEVDESLQPDRDALIAAYSEALENVKKRRAEELSEAPQPTQKIKDT